MDILVRSPEVSRQAAPDFLNRVAMDGRVDSFRNSAQENWKRRSGDEQAEYDLSPRLPAPPGYVLYQAHIKLKPSAWLPGHHLPAFSIIDGRRYAREEDMLIPSATAKRNKGSNSAKAYRCPSGDDEPWAAAIVHQANIKEYVYTGNAEMDLKALRAYLERLTKAIGTLDAYVPGDRAAAANRWVTRHHIEEVRDDVREEVQAVLTEVDDPNEEGYVSFDEFDMGLPPLPRRRPKGYVWRCRI
ncbi:hypothetical protein AAFC00_005247 [Neodothiora populina]|uniref:EF-hand domain-containing protein n=1 Tax=Neodothiora populina TaxID=2781224 RepID=A0ABR3PKM4_9PEZI